MSSEASSDGAASQQKQTQQPMLVEQIDEGAAADAPDAMTRRRFMQTAAATAAIAAVGTGNVAAAEGDVTPNFDSAFAHSPWVNASVDIDLHEPGFSTLDHVNDDGDVENYSEHGIVLAPNRADKPDETPHNPVSYMAKDFVAVSYNDDGSIDEITPHAEYAAFPRSLTYDHDADSDTDEEDVSALDAEHWTTDASGSTGTINVTDASNGGLRVEVTGQADGDVATATFDLSSVGSEDATITSGANRKFLQIVGDIDVLNASSRAEIRVGASDGTEAVAFIDPDGDVSTDACLANATGDSQVGQARVGDLGDLSDIQTVTIAVLDEQFDGTFYGLNVEKEVEWEFGTQEYLDSEDELDTRTLTQPSGTISVSGLDTLTGTPFEGTGIRNISYDAEMQVDDLPGAQIMARVVDTPDTYSYPKELEIVATFDPQEANAYDTSMALSNLQDKVGLPSSRYTAVETATTTEDYEEWDWDDVEDVTWTGKTSKYDSVDSTVELLAAVGQTETTHVRHRVLLKEDEVSAATVSGGAAVQATGGGGGAFSAIKTFAIAAVGVLMVWKRNFIRAVLGGIKG